MFHTFNLPNQATPPVPKTWYSLLDSIVYGKLAQCTNKYHRFMGEMDRF